jgi:hypothetical protein
MLDAADADAADAADAIDAANAAVTDDRRRLSVRFIRRALLSALLAAPVAAATRDVERTRAVAQARDPFTDKPTRAIREAPEECQEALEEAGGSLARYLIPIALSSLYTRTPTLFSPYPVVEFSHQVPHCAYNGLGCLWWCQYPTQHVCAVQEGPRGGEGTVCEEQRR